MMMKKLQAVAMAFGLLLYSTSSMAMMHEKENMYNLTIGGLAGGGDAKGIDDEFRRMDGVEKVHVDFDNGMIMVWLEKGKALDQGLAERLIKQAGFTLNDFEVPN